MLGLFQRAIQPDMCGLASLELLGHTDEHGRSEQLGDRRWSLDDNGNPDDMEYLVKSILGTQDTTLFIIERDTNRNVCHYQVNLTPSGEPYANGAVKPSWCMITKDADLDDMSIEDVSGNDVIYEEALSGIEPMVYGVAMIDSTHFQIHALKGETFTLERDPVTDTWRALLTIEGRPWVVKRIYLHTKSATAMGDMFPRVSEIHVVVQYVDSDKKFTFYYAKND